MLLINISTHRRLDQFITHLLLSRVLTIDLKHLIFSLVVAVIKIAKITMQACQVHLAVTYKHDHH